MSAEKAVIEILLANTAIDAVVQGDIDAGMLAQDTQAPAYAVTHISTITVGHLAVAAGSHESLVSRVQVTAIAETYPQLALLMEMARSACGNRSGSFGGVTVRSTRVELVGPDMKTPDDQWFMKTVDVRVMWIRALP